MTTTTTKPSTPTAPRRRRALAQTKTGPMSDRPLTSKLMKRALAVIEHLSGDKSRASIAEQRQKFAMAIGKSYNEATEYLAGFRSCPNSEVTLRIQRWIEENEPSVAVTKSLGRQECEDEFFECPKCKDQNIAKDTKFCPCCGVRVEIPATAQ